MSDADVHVELTSLGKKRAEDISGGGPAYRCLAALYEERKPMSVEEVAREAGISIDHAKVMLRRLAKMGLVRRA